MDEPVPNSTAETAITRPYWIPAGVDFDSMSDELKAAIVGFINPAYRELVLRAREGLEQSTGMTIVHLMWLEVMDQIHMGKDFEGAGEPNRSKEHAKNVSQYLRLAGAKNKASSFLLRMHEFREKWGAPPGYHDPLREAFRR